MDVLDDKGNILASFDDPDDGSRECGCDSSDKEPSEIALEISVGDDVHGNTPENATHDDGRIKQDGTEGEEISLLLPLYGHLQGNVATRDTYEPLPGDGGGGGGGGVYASISATYENCDIDQYGCGNVECHIVVHIKVPENLILFAYGGHYKTWYCYPDCGSCEQHSINIIDFTCNVGPIDSQTDFTYGIRDSVSFGAVSTQEKNSNSVHFHVSGDIECEVSIRLWHGTYKCTPESDYLSTYCHWEQGEDGYGKKYYYLTGREKNYRICKIENKDYGSVRIDDGPFGRFGSRLVFSPGYWDGMCDITTDRHVYVVIGLAYELVQVVRGYASGTPPICGEDNPRSNFKIGTTVYLSHYGCPAHSRDVGWAMIHSTCRTSLHFNQYSSFQAAIPGCWTIVEWKCQYARHYVIYYQYPDAPLKKVVDKWTYSKMATHTIKSGKCKYDFEYWEKTKNGKLVKSRDRTVYLNLVNGELSATVYYVFKEYSLTIATTPPDGGIFHVSKEGPYHSGDIVTILVTAYNCYRLMRYDNAENEFTETVKFECKDITKEYTFMLKKYMVYAYVEGGCRCSVDIDGTDENGAVECGGSVTITAVPGKCSRFLGWSTGDSGISITLDDIVAEVSVTAYFDICRDTSGNGLVFDGDNMLTCGGAPIYGNRTC